MAKKPIWIEHFTNSITKHDKFRAYIFPEIRGQSGRSAVMRMFLAKNHGVLTIFLLELRAKTMFNSLNIFFSGPGSFLRTATKG